MLNVAFLLDQSNDWILNYIPLYFKKLKKIRYQIFYKEFEVKDFDIVFVLGFTKILKGQIFKKNKLLLVVHSSDLPKGRGFAPTQWQILDGKKKITVCLLEVSKKFDSGDIYEKTNIILDGSELYKEIRHKQAEATFKLIQKFLKKYPNFNSTSQFGKPTYYRKRIPEDSQLNINKSIKSQFNLLRICNNEEWPAFFVLNGIKYILKIEKSKL